MEMPANHPRAAAGREPENLDLNEVIALAAVVHGTVQGVGFRYWCWRQAEKLGLTGTATNNDDGTVSVVAEGPRWAVGDLLKALISRDTPGAVITVDEHFGPATGQYTDFTTH
ncbi:acylphosphatase [Kocuria tytonicola]|uniref:acylphosphatase n=1 Tax=Kocuria tytonicola TaxID=2055946 RepID=A0A3L9LAF7_9MICC|nr:acylphosphatase [Kocuria tytonicola]RLY95144.1 acylphosphatase [Kocuria tytonicola]RLZ02958.1 acylphosphatase [Kocuria tytonicola]